MQLILDNLTALLVTSTLLVILLVVHQRTQSVQVQETNYSALRKHQVNFVQTLQRDISGIYRLESTEEQADSTFAFWTRLADSPDTVRVVYRRRKVGERAGLDLYQVLRYESTTGAMSFSASNHHGGSIPSLTDWSIAALNRDGNAPEGPEDARQVRVRFEALAPFDDGDELLRRPWEATYYPVMLNRNRL